MNVNRREFIYGSVASLMSTYLLSSCRSVRPASANSGKAFVFMPDGNGKSLTRVLDLNTLEYKDILLPLGNPHSAQKLYTNPNQFIAFDFNGFAAMADLQSGETKRVESETVFMGHATQTESGKYIWCTEILKSGKIHVQARSTSDMSIVQGNQFKFEGGHHIVRLPATELLATSWYDHAQLSSNIRFQNLRNQQFSCVRLPDDLVVSHLLPVSSTEVVCITNYLRKSGGDQDKWDKREIVQSSFNLIMKHTPKSSVAPQLRWEIDLARPAPLIYANTKGESKIFWSENEIERFRFGFSMDLIPGSDLRFASTHSVSDSLAIWKGQGLDYLVSVPNPMGVIASPDGKNLIVLSEGKLKFFSLTEKRFTSEVAYEKPITCLARYA